MPSDPLTPEEVTALEAELITNPDLLRALATIRDRERDRDSWKSNYVTALAGWRQALGERDEQQKRADDWREQFVNRLETITQLSKERDELQRKLDGWRELAIEIADKMDALRRSGEKLAASVRKGEGGTE